MKATLPNVVMSIREEKYEHLDTMWADTAKDNVFPRVSDVLPQHASIAMMLFRIEPSHGRGAAEDSKKFPELLT